MSAWFRLRQYAALMTITLFVIPVSTNYHLRELTLGNASGGVGSSPNHQIEGSIGGLQSPLMNGTTYQGGLGFGFTQMANVPPAPTLSNTTNSYNQLHAVIDPGNNPADTLFAIAISADGFSTTSYVKQDQSVGAVLELTDYQTYAGWGGGGGFDIIGLQPSTGYEIKVKAMSGDFTESGFGPSDAAATVAPTLSFDIDVSNTDTETSSPYQLAIGSLVANTVVTGTDKIWIDFSTNAINGGSVYLAASTAGLFSATASHTIPSASVDLTGADSGFGLRADTMSQGSGGPLESSLMYDGQDDEVGILDTTIRTLFTSQLPITDGRGSAMLKAKSSALTPAAQDYATILTVIAAASF